MAARLLVAAAFVMTPSSLRAGGGAERDPYDDLRGDGPVLAAALADVYLSHNFNNPKSGRSQLRQFDFASDLPALGYLRLTLAHRPRHIGFRVDAGVGDTADAYLAEDPAATTHPELARWMSRIEQAFVTVIVPARRRIAIDVGKFNTPVGLEDNETPTNWNYSRSLTFSFAEPTLHTGIRLTVVATAGLAISLFWINGWNSNFTDGSDMRSYAIAATWTPREGIEVALVYAGGLERAPMMLADPHLAFRNLVDAYVVYSPLAWLSLAASADYGNDRAHGGVDFWGVDAYLRVSPTRWLSLAGRGEYFADPDGFTTGTRQSLGGVTATLLLQKVIDGAALMTWVEVRHDTSTATPFERGDRPATARSQDTLTLAMSVHF